MTPDAGWRVGYGEDSHRLEAGLRLVIAGIAIAGAPHGAVAHSDGDVVLHAISDALLSSAALGDIGSLFPDSDPAHAGLDSSKILSACLDRAGAAGLTPVNAAVVVTLDRPKLGPLRDEMASRLAALLGVDADSVGLTFKTSEGLAPAHVQARASLMLRFLSPERPQGSTR